MSRLVVIVLTTFFFAESFVGQTPAQTKEIQESIEKILQEIRAKEAAHVKEIQALRSELLAVKEQMLKQALYQAKVIDELKLKLLLTEKQARIAEATALAKDEAHLERILLLTKLLRDQEALIQALKQQGVAVPMKTPPKPAVDAPANLKGKVTKVEVEAGVIEVSLGADHGLKAGHTLEVYRLGPSAEYLGSIRIVQTTPQRSIGRLTQTNPLKKASIKVGDEVATSLTP